MLYHTANGRLAGNLAVACITKHLLYGVGMNVEDLKKIGYIARHREYLAVTAMLSHRGGGAAALLLEGAPGTGKTALGEAVAKVLGCPLVFGQLHNWSDADELFVGVDVAAAVAGDAASVRQPGTLARAAELSQQGRVVLLLDEVDKASERTEALLLDFLQSGRVPMQPGRHVVARLENLLVFITSNGQRDLGDALLRRVRRVWIDPLPVEVLDRLVAGRSGAPKGVATLISKACRDIAQAEGHVVSLQEIANAAREAWEIAESAEDIGEILAAWAARSESAAHTARAHKLRAAVWAEVMASRRAG